MLDDKHDLIRSALPASGVEETLGTPKPEETLGTPKAEKTLGTPKAEKTLGTSKTEETADGHEGLVLPRRIVCDFDGTVTPFDVTDALLENFASEEWKELESRWEEGAITARECMAGQIPLLRASLEEMDAFLDTVPLTEGFPEFVRFCRENAFSLSVVSDGLDHTIQRVLSRHGITLPVFANRLIWKDGRFSLEFPYGREGCPSGMCKCAVAGWEPSGAPSPGGGKGCLPASALPGSPLGKQGVSVAGKPVSAAQESPFDGSGKAKGCPPPSALPFFLLGDGSSDCCVARHASFVLARRGLKLERVCRKEGIPVAPYDDFRGILEFVARHS